MTAQRAHRTPLRLVAISIVLVAVHGASTTPSWSTARSGKSLLVRYEGAPLAFEVNTGQAGSQVDFLSRGSGYALFLNATGIDISLAMRQRTRFAERTHIGSTDSADPIVLTPVRLNLVGSNPHARGSVEEELPAKVNILHGSDPRIWHYNIATYRRVRYKAVYPGIDLIYYGKQNQLEYDFVVAPGVDPRAITFDFEGPAEVRIDSDSNLLVGMEGQTVLAFHKPLVYQQTEGHQREIAGKFVVDGQRVSFKIGEYDRAKPLVIDPILGYSTHLGGSGPDGAQGIAVDAQGNAYITGDTASADFPRKNALQKNLGGNTDAYVAKFNTQGQLVYCTYLGGTSSDAGFAIALDQHGDIYVTGDTRSSDFPVVGPAQKALAGSADVFVAKLSGDGSRIIYSTYLGGSAGERGQGIAVDRFGNAVVTGYTQSTDFPTATPLQAAFGGGNADAFVFKLNASGSALIYSTYLGGGNDRPDIGNAIAVDAEGNAYVTGITNARDFPTVKSIQPFIGPTDIFVTKINPSGSALVYSTFLGGIADDEAMGIAVDAAGSAYITGETESPNFPTTAGALSPKCHAIAADLPPALGGHMCPLGDAFVLKLLPDGSGLAYSTFIKGTNFDVGRSIAVDRDGNAYVTGFTGSPDFPVVNPLQKNFAGVDRFAFDAFVLKLNPAGSALVYSTFLGGHGVDGGYGIALDAEGNAYVAGITESGDFPTKGPLRRTLGGSRDAFVAKISSQNPR